MSNNSIGLKGSKTSIPESSQVVEENPGLVYKQLLIAIIRPGVHQVANLLRIHCLVVGLSVVLVSGRELVWQNRTDLGACC